MLAELLAKVIVVVMFVSKLTLDVFEVGKK